MIWYFDIRINYMNFLLFDRFECKNWIDIRNLNNELNILWTWFILHEYRLWIENMIWNWWIWFMLDEYKLWYESMIHDLRWFILDEYKLSRNRIKDWRIWFINKRKLWSMINENAKFSIDFKIDSFKSRHFKNQLIIV